jgi:hypothetical protein
VERAWLEVSSSSYASSTQVVLQLSSCDAYDSEYSLRA